MGFESYRQGAFTKRLADLPDQPNMQAAELKTYFDSSPEELRQALNRLCDALGEFSAAAKLGRNCALNLSGYKYSFAVFA